MHIAFSCDYIPMTNGQCASQPLIITAADHRLARTLMQMLYSATRHGEDKRFSWAVYDVGLLATDRDSIKRCFPWIEIRCLNSGAEFSYTTISADRYALKPEMIHHAARRCCGLLFWFDCSAIFHQSLDAAISRLAREGFWGMRGQFTLGDICDVSILDAMNLPLEVRHLRGYSAASIGFDLGVPLGRGLVEDWARKANDIRHMARSGLPTSTDCDQSLLNCLLAKTTYAGHFAPTHEESEGNSGRHDVMVSTGNYVSSNTPLLDNRLIYFARAALRAGDSIYHRSRMFAETTFDGLKGRLFGDHFTVKLRRISSGHETALPGPRSGFYADPFLIQRGGFLWLFMEEFNYAADRGQLIVAGLDDDLQVTSIDRVEMLPNYAALDCHASYPWVFDVDGETYMIAETNRRFTVDLFVCDTWPARWRLKRRLFFGLNAVDSMMIRHENLWYIFTSVHGETNRELHIYYSEDFRAGRFEPHPVNERRLYGDRSNGTGRNAGYIGREEDGTLVRLMQEARHRYGESVCPMRITTLTPSEFHEEPAGAIVALPGVVRGSPTHHVSRAGGVLAFDTISSFWERHRRSDGK